MTRRNRNKSFGNAILVAAAAASAELVFGPRTADAQTVTANANYSTTVETSGPFGTTSFEAAGQTADQYPAYGVVAFNAGSYTALASTGVTATAIITATEYPSASAATLTHANSVINFYFAQNPQTGSGLVNENAANGPGGFNASNYGADLVGSVTYNNSGSDAVSLTLSGGDVSYIDTVLSNLSSGKATAGSFEFFAVATTNGSSGRYYNSPAIPAMLALNAVTGSGTASGFLTYDPTGTGATASPNFTTNAAVTDFTDSGTGKDVAYADGNTVSFTDAGLAAGARTISIDPAGVAPAAVTVNTSGTYTFTGSGSTGITGAATLTKSGTGTLVISNNNAYTGGTTISGGTISIASDGALGTGNIALAGGTLAATGAITESAGTTAAGAPVRSVSVGGTGNTIITGGNALTFGGSLGGGGGLLVTGTTGGSVTFLTEASGSTIGSLNVSAGSTLALQNANLTPFVTLGSATTSAITINGAVTLGTPPNPITLELQYGNTYNGSGSITTSGTIRTYYTATTAFAATINPAVVLNGSGNQLIEADFNKSISFNGVVSGGSAGVTLGLTPDAFNGGIDGLAGPGKVTFNAPATYTGPTTLSAGTLVVNSTLASSAVSVAAPTTVVYNASSSVTYAPTLAGTGTVSGPVSLSGAITAGSGARAADTIGGLNVSGGLTIAGPAASYVVKLVGTAPAAAYNSGSSSGGTSGTTVTGADKLILGGLTVAGGGVLTINPTLLTGASLTPGQTYSFVIADDTVSATAFNALIASGGGSSIVVGPGDGFSSYTLDVKPDGSSGEDLLLDVTAAAPEPTSLLLAGLAAGPLVLRRRRRSVALA